MGQKIKIGHEEEDIDGILNSDPSLFLGIMGHALRKRAQIAHQKIQFLFNFPEVTSFSMEHLRELGIGEFATVEDLLNSLIKDLNNINDWSVLANKYAWKIDEDDQTTTTNNCESADSNLKNAT